MGKAAILNSWDTKAQVVKAGLFRPTYCTAGLEQTMVGVSQRKSIAQIIFDDTELLVYLYFACDRDFVFK